MLLRLNLKLPEPPYAYSNKLQFLNHALKAFAIFLACSFLFPSPSLASLNTLMSGEDLVTGENFKLNTAEFEKLISIKREQFRELMAFRLFASKAENNTARKFRKTIKSAVDPSLIAVSEIEAEEEWQKFYVNNFNSEADYQRLLEINYLSEDFLKAKFRDNLALEKYFNKIVVPKLLDDLVEEKLLVGEAKKRGLELSESEQMLALESLEDDLGGEKFLFKFRNKHKLSQKDIQEYVERNILVFKLKEETGILKDELVASLKEDRKLSFNQELIASYIPSPEKPEIVAIEEKNIPEDDLILEKLRKIKERVHAETQLQVSEK